MKSTANSTTTLERNWTYPRNALPSDWALGAICPLGGGLEHKLATYTPKEQQISTPTLKPFNKPPLKLKIKDNTTILQ
jgi:hypothetical protein